MSGLSPIAAILRAVIHANDKECDEKDLRRHVWHPVRRWPSLTLGGETIIVVPNSFTPAQGCQFDSGKLFDMGGLQQRVAEWDRLPSNTVVRHQP